MEKMFFIEYFDSETDQYEVGEEQAETIEQAFDQFVKNWPVVTDGRHPFKIDHITDNYSRAEIWVASSNDERRCDGLAAARFEEMAYGSRDEDY